MIFWKKKNLIAFFSKWDAVVVSYTNDVVVLLYDNNHRKTLTFLIGNIVVSTSSVKRNVNPNSDFWVRFRAIADNFLNSQTTLYCKSIKFFWFIKWLAYPCRYSDMICRFVRTIPELSLIVNRMIDLIYHRGGHSVTLPSQPWLSIRSSETFCQKIN